MITIYVSFVSRASCKHLPSSQPRHCVHRFSLAVFLLLGGGGVSAPLLRVGFTFRKVEVAALLLVDYSKPPSPPLYIALVSSPISSQFPHLICKHGTNSSLHRLCCQNPNRFVLGVNASFCRDRTHPANRNQLSFKLDSYTTGWYCYQRLVSNVL